MVACHHKSAAVFFFCCSAPLQGWTFWFWVRFSFSRDPLAPGLSGRNPMHPLCSKRLVLFSSSLKDSAALFECEAFQNTHTHTHKLFNGGFHNTNLRSNPEDTKHLTGPDFDTLNQPGLISFNYESSVPSQNDNVKGPRANALGVRKLRSNISITF